MAKNKPRKSVSMKEQAVLRLLKGEDMELVSRESGFAMHELAQWREKYMLGGRENLKSHPKDPQNVEIEQRDKLISRLALENEILKKARGDRGKPQTVDRLSQETSQTTGKLFPVDLLCVMLDVAKSSYYDYCRQQKRKTQGHERQKPGPKVQLDDPQLLLAIVAVMTASPFVTEGVKKVHARLRRKKIKASRNRINLLMRAHGLLSPQRHEQGQEKTHDGTIIPESINQLWGTDGTLFGTINGDLLWLFAVIDHFSDEVLGHHIVEVGQGDRFAALEPIKQAVRRIRGGVGKDIGNGIAIRHDWGPQYIARDFKKELEFLGLGNSPALVHQPQTNGVIERFFKTLKYECLWIENIRDVEHAREVVGDWMETYNTQWLIERHGHRTPREVRQACQEAQSSVA